MLAFIASVDGLTLLRIRRWSRSGLHQTGRAIEIIALVVTAADYAELVAVVSGGL